MTERYWLPVARRLGPLSLVLASAAIAAAAYLQALDAPFISDDTIYVADNPRLAGLRAFELWRLLVEPYNGASEFLPLRDLSYWFDIRLFGLTPPAFRLHDIFLYLLCLPFVYSITQSMWQYFRPADRAGAPWAAAAVTALFALHPAHAEAVVWISGRKDVLSGAFSLLALWLAFKAKRERGLSSPYAVATMLALLAAMYSKATAVAMAAVIALLWWIFWSDESADGRRRPPLLWPLGVLLLALCVTLTFAAITTQTVPVYFGIESITRMLSILGWLTRLAVSAEQHHFFYPVLDDPWLPAMAALGFAALLATGWGAVKLWRKRSLEGFAAVAFLLLCIPSLQLIPYKPPSLVSDRFLFLAVWMSTLLLVAVTWRFSRISRIFLLLAVASVWGFQTIERSRDWRNFETIINKDWQAFPGYYMPAAYKIVGILLPQGLYREAGTMADSITAREFRDAMAELVKADIAVHATALAGQPGAVLSQMQHLDYTLQRLPAEARWNSSIQVAWEKIQARHARQWNTLAGRFPDDMLIYYRAGTWLADAGYYKDATTYLRIATESQRLPESARGTAFKSLGLALLGSDHATEAEAALRSAVAQHPAAPEAYCLLSGVYKMEGRLVEYSAALANCPSRISSETIAPNK